ncbi:MAG: hypothetical protein JKY30_03305 [Flavobacteriales bacterium]|nr:hypothetical protein [Flavobacteriales bacterium]
MSLVIAKIIDGKIQIESDTKISGEHVVRNNPINGRLKALILAHNLVVCYAGDIALAEDAYNFFVEKAKTKIDWQEYINYLIEISKTEQVDFILTGYSTNPFILKIKNGTIEESKTAWIGDYKAFKEFQEHFVSNGKDENLSERFTNSFNLVVKNQLNPTVGEFHISVKANLDDFKLPDKTVPVFQYKIKSSLTLGRSKTVNIKKKGVAEPIPSGNAEDGTYSISYFTNFTQERSGIGMYFEFGGFGIFLCPGNLLTNKKYVTEDAQEFVNLVFKETGIELRGMQSLKDTIGFKYIGPENEPNKT